MPVYIYFWVEVICSSFAEMYADSFCFWERKPFSLVHFSTLLRQFCICLSSLGMFCDEYAMAKSSTYRILIPVLIDSVMLLILKVNSVIDKILPWRILVSCLYRSELTFPYCTVKVRWERKLLMNATVFPLIPVLWRSFRILYLHVVSYAFPRSKKIETTWWFLIRPLWMYVSSLISWSLVLWFCWNLLWHLDNMLCFSRY